jgi:hypothetical protein
VNGGCEILNENLDSKINLEIRKNLIRILLARHAVGGCKDRIGLY